jgi:hypothetical protein
MAVCGWCKTKGLHNGPAGLEVHSMPNNNRKKCEGALTSPYMPRISKYGIETGTVALKKTA